MDQKCTMIPGFSTIKPEDLKSNKGNVTFPTHTVNVIEL